MSNIIDIKNDDHESDLHIEAKNTISYYCVEKTITLTNHLNETIIINPSDIKAIKQEFTWYIKQKNPRKSFSADVALIDSNDSIIAIIEIVKTHGLSKHKFNFYQSLGIFWVELSADHVISENDNFYSSYTYNFPIIEKFNTNIYLSDLDIQNKKTITQRQKIINKIVALNIAIKNPKNKHKKNELKEKRKYLIKSIETLYEKRLKQQKYYNNKKIKEIKDDIKLLKVERLCLKEDKKSYTHINYKIKKLREKIEFYKIRHLSERTKKLRKKNIYTAKEQKKSRKLIIKIKGQLVIDIFNRLEVISKQTKLQSISYITLMQHFYNNKKFNNFNATHLKQLENLGWTYNISSKNFKRL